MVVMRSGTRRVGASPIPQPIDTVARCNGCRQEWERDYGEQGRWRLPGRIYLGWEITKGPQMRAGGGGSVWARYHVVKGDDERLVDVELTGSLLATDPATLDDEYLRTAVETNGASCLYRLMATAEPPTRLTLHTKWCPYE